METEATGSREADSEEEEGAWAEQMRGEKGEEFERRVRRRGLSHI